MNAVVFTWFLFCLIAAGIAGYSTVILLGQRIQKKKIHEGLLEPWEAVSGNESTMHENDRGIQYLEHLSQSLFCGTTQPIVRCVRKNRAARTSRGTWYRDHAQWAGCAQNVSSAAFCEATFRLALIGCLVGGVTGLVFSLQLALLLALCGAVFGFVTPFNTMRRQIKRRAEEAELHLSGMLQIVSLGLRSGLTFDLSFALYGRYFDNPFSRSCAQAYRRWMLGLSSREESLKEFAASYECEQLSRAIESVLRSLRFGSSLAPILEEASSQARASYRARLEERVAKAPVKMMLPTGTLILPAMLLFVLGPVLLELIQGF